MNDTAELIREQMHETRSQLSEKLVSLEHQVSQTVQSTGTAVNATVEAVQETIETVTEAVQDAVHSVSNVLDVPHHIERHPWLALGGSVLLGYLAAEYLGRSKQPVQPLGTTLPANPLAENAEQETTGPAVQSAATAAALAAAYESGLRSSSWQQLRSMAIGAFIGIAQDMAARAVPPLMNYLAGKQGNAPSGPAMASQTSENATTTMFPNQSRGSS